MTQDDIFRLAKESGAYWEHGDFNMPIPVGFYNEKDLIIFAQRIAAREREACAKVCDQLSSKHTWEGCYANECAEAIRARGNK